MTTRPSSPDADRSEADRSEADRSEADRPDAASFGVADTFGPLYFAVIFTSRRRATSACASENPLPDYATVAARMVELASAQPGYLGMESVRDADGLGVTISYWTSLDAIRAWGQNLEHQFAQQAGRDHFYTAYQLRICQVMHDRTWPARGTDSGTEIPVRPLIAPELRKQDPQGRET